MGVGDLMVLKQCSNCISIIATCSAFLCVSFYMTCRFGKHFELPLLVQSIIMIVTMMAMMHICVEVNTDKGTVVRKLTGDNPYDVQYMLLWL